MRRLFLGAIIVVVTITIGLYAQEKVEVAEEPKVKLELVWESEIPAAVKDDWPYPGDLVFLDENGYNVFSSQCKDPEKALKEKRALMIHDGIIKWLADDDMKIVEEMEISEGSSPNSNKVVISKNGRNIAIIEGLERYRLEELIENNVQNKNPGDFRNTHATIRLLNWKGEELASTQFSLKEWEYIDLYPLGNDQTVILNLVGGEGQHRGVKIFVNKDKNLVEVFSNEEGSVFIDYSEDSRRILLVIENQGTGVFNDLGEEECRYVCLRSLRSGYLSPKGNYIVEITAGKYVMIFDHQGHLIDEHHVQGRGDYCAAFTSDGNYLCVTPGPWRIYFFETSTGELLWEYVDTLSRFRSIAVAPQGDYIFSSSTLFHPTNLTLQEKADKSLVVFNDVGHLLYKTVVSAVESSEELAFYRWESATPPLRITSDGKFLMVRLPSNLLLYRIVQEEGGR